MTHNDPCFISPILILVRFRLPFFNYYYYYYNLIKEITAVLQAYEDTKATVTLGVLLTLQPAPAFNFSKPVLVVAGDRD
jgi:hypothetical protein